MNRTGFCVDELKDVIHFIEDNKQHLDVKGLRLILREQRVLPITSGKKTNCILQ